MGREVGRRFKREGTYVHLRLIHVDVWQKPTQFCKSIILQLKNKLKKRVDWKEPGSLMPLSSTRVLNSISILKVREN